VGRREAPGRLTVPRGPGGPARPSRLATLLALLVAAAPSWAVAQAAPPGEAAPWIAFRAGPGRFPVAAGGRSAPLAVDSSDWPGVIRAVRDLARDIGRVTGREPGVAVGALPAAREVVVVGTLGRGGRVDALVRAGAIDTAGVGGRWEATLVQVVERPWPGVDRALVIAGSDKRGTIYGVYGLSARIGVSPWTWWADVPPARHAALYALPGRRTEGPPAVRYRGIFLNDEAPALAGWARATFGGLDHRFYEKVFELILRLKGNYLWPAMWDNAFNEDDSLNPRLADEVGIVMGTSHHEPMLRAQQEWKRHGTGPWNYQTNDSVLRVFWRQGIRTMDSHESIVTVGMRGDGDLPMSDSANIGLLEHIVTDQRAIIAQVTGRPARETPQDWALYKEVQDYYDRGMRVPDDVTLLFSDDNWGDLRRLPAAGSAPRTGGYGLYYHFDYVGGPRNYKWINTNAVPRVWEQLHLAYAYGVDRIWIVNVGDLKPMELPISFFLDYAWDPGRWPVERLPSYARAWAAQQFGPAHAAEIGAVLDDYGRYSARRKPELLDAGTFSLDDGEWDRVVGGFDALEARARHLKRLLPSASRAAYGELVLHPVLALGNLYRLYEAVARNRLYAGQGRASANAWAARARALFARDAAITAWYNDTLAGGKWRHMMDQTHIGYTTWQQPPENVMPEVREIPVVAAPDMGVAVAGSGSWWPADTAPAALRELSACGAVSGVELFNRGATPFAFTAASSAPWLVVTPDRGTVEQDRRLRVSVDWRRAPAGAGLHEATIAIRGAGRSVVVHARLRILGGPRPRGFVESDGVVAMEAEHDARAVAAPPIAWVRIPGLGRTRSGMTAFPVTAPGRTAGGDGPRLEYRVRLLDSGEVAVRATFSPTLDFHATGLRYAVSFDDQAPQVVNLAADTTLRAWERWVSDNANVSLTHHRVAAGDHVLRYWLVDPGVVLQRLEVDRGRTPPDYLGAPENACAPQGRAGPRHPSETE